MKNIQVREGSRVAQMVKNLSAMQVDPSKFDPWIGKIPWRRKWQLTPVFLPGESHGQRSMAGYSPRGRKELDTTERLTLLLSREGKAKSQRNIERGSQNEINYQPLIILLTHAFTYSSKAASKGKRVQKQDS